MVGEPTSFIITPETRKMPLPMMVPTTIAMACQTLRSRTSSRGAACSAACIGFPMLDIFDHQTCQIAYNKGGCGSEGHIPGPGNLRFRPEIDVQNQPGEHTKDCASVRGPACEKAEEKAPQQPTVGERGDGQAFLQNLTAMT